MSVVGVSYAGKPVSNTAMYITKKVEHLVLNLKNAEGCKVFIEDTIEIPADIAAKNEFIRTPAPQRDYATFAAQIANEKMERDKTRKYTVTAGNYTIGENVTIGENALIEPGVFIGHDVVIGKNALIKSGVRIRDAVIGDNFTCFENAVIGYPAFTVAEDEHGNKFRIPSFGGVEIGNGVDIGAGALIETGASANTVIGDYVKIDGLVFIGHESNIGSNTEIAGAAMIGGFVTVGEYAFLGLNCTIRNRISIGNHVMVGMGSVVTKSVEDGVTVVGNPAKPFQKQK